MKRLLNLAIFLLAGSLIVTAPVKADGLFPVESIYDFGEVGIDFYVFHNYKLVNKSDEPIKIDSAITRCDCSYVWVPDSVVAPGDTGIVRLRFSTRDYYGRVSKSIKVWPSGGGAAKQDLFYLTTVGQWFLGLKPDPISLFFLPGQDVKTITIPNTILDEAKIVGVDAYDDIPVVTLLEDEADKGDALKVEVTPREGLQKGTYLSNLRLEIEVEGQKEPIYMSFPVKVVRY